MLGFEGAEVTPTPGIGLPRKDCISVSETLLKTVRSYSVFPFPEKEAGWMR